MYFCGIFGFLRGFCKLFFGKNAAGVCAGLARFCVWEGFFPSWERLFCLGLLPGESGRFSRMDCRLAPYCPGWFSGQRRESLTNYTAFRPGDGRPENSLKPIGAPGGNLAGQSFQPENREGEGHPFFDVGRHLSCAALPARRSFGVRRRGKSQSF